MSETHVVTGAYGYSGRYIARRLLDSGIAVRTLTNRRAPGDPLSARVPAAPLDFGRPRELAASLEGARVLYNTYWVRFERGGATHATAVRNTRILVEAALEAGVERIVHVSITNPGLDSTLPYFRGKAELEELIGRCGLSHAIVRPTVLFGEQDILINNIAYLLRRLPVFGVPGRGSYPIQPVFVDDLASIMVDLAARTDDVTVDAVGPETYAYIDLVRLIRDEIGVRTPVVRVPGPLVLAAGRMLGMILGDVVITADEIRGLSSGLLVSRDTPTCGTSFRAWVREHRGTLGRRYACELSRHFRQEPA